MKKIMKIALASLWVFALFLPIAHAVCPVCTIAVGAGLEGARLLGVDDVITGIWAGALTLSLFFWTVGWLKRHNVKSIWIQIVLPFVVYYGLLAGIYWLPGITFGQNTLWGIDKFLMGLIVGTIAFYGGARWYNVIKAKNGGHAKFAFQKVVVPLSFLLGATTLFAMIVYL
jgi:hypothetical protein